MKPQERPSWARRDVPPGVVRSIPVITVGAKDDRKVVVLSSSLFGVFTHWTGARTAVCDSPTEKCECRHEGKPRRWKAFLHCYELHTKTSFFVELSDLAASKLLNVIGE